MIDIEEILNARILLIDDQEENVFLLTTLLESKGYKNIKSITDSRKAIETYKNFCPDLLILDLEMPIVNGFDIMNEIQKIEENSYCPILILTAKQDKESKIKALQMGAKGFITKPIDSTETLIHIQNMLEVRLLHNRINEQNIILEQKVMERTKELMESQREIIHKLSLAIEYRDNITGSHALRVSAISHLLGQKIGLNEQHCSLLRDAAALHDTGKLGIPDTILLRPDKLDEKQRLLMEKHSEFGANLLSGSKSELLKMAEIVALTHHERWNGSGYPKKLKGEQIPLEGRICAIADVFDTITSNRLYKKAKSMLEGINEIRKKSGIDFDPKLVDAFFDIIPEITKIKESNK
ncbi:MAG: HD domain-containing phosphohydrolase [bacterium]